MYSDQLAFQKPAGPDQLLLIWIYSFLIIICDIWPRGYKTFSMLNSTEHELSTAHKN